jgi:hypothetical protein
MKALLIDPYQRKIHEIQISKDLSAWHAMLECDYVDRVEVSRNKAGTRALDVWIDDEGLMKEPVAPLFKVRGCENPLAGYGLVLGADLTNGKSIDCPLTLTVERLRQNIAFEPWEKRLDPRDYFAQLTRVPSWEAV